MGVECPFCGKEEDNMLSLNENGALVFTCFRASCPGSGTHFLDDGGFTVIPSTVKKSEFKPRIYDRPYTLLNRDTFSFLADKYDISNLATVGYSEDDKRYIFRLYTVEGNMWGVQARSYTGATPKALLYKERDVPSIAFVYRPYPAKTDTLVLTEDIVSAMKIKAHTGIDAAALLGTDLGDDALRVVVKHYSHVVIWLDWDTWQAPANAGKGWMPKPLKLKRKLSMHVPTVDVICSRQDPKDTEVAEIKGWLYM